MKIEERNTTIRELAEGYEDNDEQGVVAFGGELDVRPPYQREFVYKDAQRDAVIDTLFKGFPLNVMYWAARKDGGYEIIDGQQRTVSICQYVEGDFAFKGRYFHNLQEDEKARILNYELKVYLCSGDDSEKLEWFKTINIAGEELTDQELRNAVYAGSWTADAKRYFSKTGCPAYNLGSDYMTGSPIRQDYLETAIDWLSGGDIEGYMAIHQHDAEAADLWLCFKGVIAWVEARFPVKRSEMKSVPWGRLYNEFKDTKLDSEELEARVAALMMDDEVQKKSGIYAFVLTGDERNLNLRQFSPAQRREAFELQKGVCPVCDGTFLIEEMEADHITPWHAGGKTVAENCQMLCKDDNRKKGGS